MKILSLDTSMAVATVAIMDDGKIIAEEMLNNKKTHSQNLMLMVDNVCSRVGLKAADMDYLAVGIGPGSFTGLRIGITTIKTIAFACDKKVIPINTLDALAYGAGYANGIVCPIIDARNNQAFTAMYESIAFEKNIVGDYEALVIDDIIEKVKQSGKDAWFVGDAVGLHRDRLEKELGDRAIFLPEEFNYMKASSVAGLAMKEIEKGNFYDAEYVNPFYLRKSQAEQEYERNNK